MNVKPSSFLIAKRHRGTPKDSPCGVPALASSLVKFYDYLENNYEKINALQAAERNKLLRHLTNLSTYFNAWIEADKVKDWGRSVSNYG